MHKRKFATESTKTMNPLLTQNRLLQSNLLDSSSSEFSTAGLSIRGSNLRALSLKNTMLSNPILTKTAHSSEISVEKQTDVKKKSVTPREEPMEDDELEERKLLMEAWSELASVKEDTEFSLDVLRVEISPTPWISEPQGFLEQMSTKIRLVDSRELKTNLLQFIAASLVDGGVLKRTDGRLTLASYLHTLSRRDPEFILKCGLYCRKELNIRTTANAILACACLDKSCYPYLDKYFSSIISLPSDWIEVAEYFKAMTTPGTKKLSLPKPMRRNMIAKFVEFDEYQLAKHNKEKGRIKRAKKLQTKKKQKIAHSPADHIESAHPFVNMKPTCLTLKYLIRVLHIHLPTSSVMCLLGKKYPSSATEFVRLGLEGTWNPELSGTRMKLPSPETWETELSKHGNNSETWESLIMSSKVPYMAMLRNIRNIIKSGVPFEVHDEVIRKLTNPNAVASSKLFPSRFFTAYIVLDELRRDLEYNLFLQRLHKQYSTKAGTRHRVTVKKPTKSKAKRQLEAIAPKGVPAMRYTIFTLSTYREALNKAIRIAIQSNLPPIRGNTLIICSVFSQLKTNKLSKQLKSSGMGSDVRSIAAVLAFMCAQICECSTTYALLDHADRCYAVSDRKQSGQSRSGILEQCQRMLSDFMHLRSFSLTDCLEDFNAIGYHFDSVYLIGDMCPAVAKFVAFQRAHVGPVCAVWSNLTGRDTWTHLLQAHRSLHKVYKQNIHK